MHLVIKRIFAHLIEIRDEETQASELQVEGKGEEQEVAGHSHVRTEEPCLIHVS